MTDLPKELSDFLAGYDEAVRELALATRELVLRLVPDAVEVVLPRWKTISYGAPRGRGKNTKFCAISPHKEWVNLQLHAGTALDDPRGLLEGTGKSMRHVKIDKPGRLRAAGLSGLVREAADAARL